MSIISNQNSSILKSVVLGGLEQFNCPTWDSSGRGLVRRIPTLYLGTFNNRQLNYVIFIVKPSPFDFSPMCDKQFFLLQIAFSFTDNSNENFTNTHHSLMRIAFFLSVLQTKLRLSHVIHSNVPIHPILYAPPPAFLIPSNFKNPHRIRNFF